MFGTSNVEPLLRVEGYALGNGAEVTAELAKDVAKLVVGICLLNHPQMDEPIGRITGGREGGREKERDNEIFCAINRSISNKYSIYIYGSWLLLKFPCIVCTDLQQFHY